MGRAAAAGMDEVTLVTHFPATRNTTKNELFTMTVE
jgi:hypothetical protein